MPSRGLAALLAVTSTTESPYRTITAPLACLASLPVSNRSGLPLIETSRVVIEKSAVPVLQNSSSVYEVRTRRTRRLLTHLLANVESSDEVRVALRVLGFQIVKQPAAASDEHQEAAP